MKKLGILGGLGPLASAVFLRQIVDLTPADSDQEHIETLLYSVPSIPDRSRFLTGKGGQSPLPALIAACGILQSHVDIIAIPCVTAHHFYDEIAAKTSVLVMDMHLACTQRIVREGITKLGLLATDGTVASGRLAHMLSEQGIVVSTPQRQSSVMELIYGVKAGKTLDFSLFRSITGELIAGGCDGILLGCTEFSMYSGEDCGCPVLDAGHLFAKACVDACIK